MTDSPETPASDDFDEELVKLSEGQRWAKKFDETGGRFIDFLESSGEIMTEIERLQAYALAAQKCIEEISGAEPPDSRKTAERELRLSGLYYGPWKTLVSQEFHGEGMSDKEVADLNSAIAERLEQQIQGIGEIASESHRYLEFLQDRGVITSVDDHLFATQLVTLKKMAEIRRKSSREEALVQLHKTERTDQAWFDLVHQEFPE